MVNDLERVIVARRIENVAGLDVGGAERRPSHGLQHLLHAEMVGRIPLANEELGHECHDLAVDGLVAHELDNVLELLNRKRRHGFRKLSAS